MSPRDVCPMLAQFLLPPPSCSSSLPRSNVHPNVLGAEEAAWGFCFSPGTRWALSGGFNASPCAANTWSSLLSAQRQPPLVLLPAVGSQCPQSTFSPLSLTLRLKPALPYLHSTDPGPTVAPQNPHLLCVQAAPAPEFTTAAGPWGHENVYNFIGV